MKYDEKKKEENENTTTIMSKTFSVRSEKDIVMISSALIESVKNS